MTQLGTTTARSRSHGHVLPWVIWSVGALFYCYGSAQRVAPSVITSELMRDFDVGAGVVGNMSAAYLYPYAALQVPLGVLLDRWGSRRTLTAMALLCAAGSLVFALADNVSAAYLGRAMVGLGAGVGLIGTLKIATVWLPPRRFALASGAALTASTIGATLGQAPYSKLAAALGWRPSMVVGAAAALVLAIVLASVRMQPPPGMGPSDRMPTAASRASGTVHDVLRVIGSRRTWLVAVYGASMALPFFAFAMLWGVPFLSSKYDVPPAVAALGTTAMLLGWGVGSPLFGWWVDRIRRVGPPMIVGALVSPAAVATAVYAPSLAFPLVCAVLLLAGLAGGAMMLTFSVARSYHANELSGSIYGVVNMIVVGVGALSQPLIGALLDVTWRGGTDAGVRTYGAAEFSLALAVLPAAGLVALATALLLPGVGRRAGRRTGDGTICP